MFLFIKIILKRLQIEILIMMSGVKIMKYKLWFKYVYICVFMYVFRKENNKNNNYKNKTNV